MALELDCDIQEKKIATILADKKSGLAQKVVHYILCCTIDQIAELTPIKLAEIFNIPIYSLEILFEKNIKKSLAEYLVFHKMFIANNLMRKKKIKSLGTLKLAKMLGYKRYQDFIRDFESQFLIHPERLIAIMDET